jgi:hypothetical protein
MIRTPSTTADRILTTLKNSSNIPQITPDFTAEDAKSS